LHGSTHGREAGGTIENNIAAAICGKQFLIVFYSSLLEDYVFLYRPV
jgi:hypothetical protein